MAGVSGDYLGPHLFLKNFLGIFFFSPAPVRIMFPSFHSLPCSFIYISSFFFTAFIPQSFYRFSSSSLSFPVVLKFYLPGIKLPMLSACNSLMHLNLIRKSMLILWGFEYMKQRGEICGNLWWKLCV